MAFYSGLAKYLGFDRNSTVNNSIVNDKGFVALLDQKMAAGGLEAYHASVVKDYIDKAQYNTSLNSPLVSLISKSSQAQGGMVGINDYGIKGRRQYVAERRRLTELYAIVLNNADVRTAVTHLRNEIFRRGLEWEPAFEFKCDVCDSEYTSRDAKRMGYRCWCGESDEKWNTPNGIDLTNPQDKNKSLGNKLRKPNPREIKKFDKFLDHANYFGQSLESIFRSCEDDLNVLDDAYIYYRKEYSIDDITQQKAERDPFNDNYAPKQKVIHIFRLDPTLVEHDMNAEGIPGMAHHVCVFHRDNILDTPDDEGWDVNWKGICPTCGLKTYPIYYVYNSQLSGIYGAAKPKSLHLLESEVTHWSRFSPSETYGYPPLLSIYEKALTLIGMDRYLYDYFYERRVPQGVVTVVTDDVNSFNTTKADVEAKMQQDPHYIPWMAISSKSGQGKMDFIRFAYSLDELDYLPVRDEIRERISGLYGVSNIWMQSTEGIGGLNNESQQLTVMSRVVEGAQRSYHTDVFPKLVEALHIKDWILKIKQPEESTELVELQVKQTKANFAQTMVGMGFGCEYDSETEEFTFSGKIPSMEEQQKQQMQAGDPFSPKPPFSGGAKSNGAAAPKEANGVGLNGLKGLGETKPTSNHKDTGQAQAAQTPTATTQKSGSGELASPYGR